MPLSAEIHLIAILSPLQSFHMQWNPSQDWESLKLHLIENVNLI